jgi:hypothetical protein
VRTAVVYIMPLVNVSEYAPMAKRFMGTYHEHPPGKSEHEVCVVLNGESNLVSWATDLFNGFGCRIIKHNNYGKDIGAYIAAADQIECDLMVCMGTPVHFHKPLWLDRIVSTYLQHGPAMYGPWGFQQPMPHLRTTVFWLPPELLLAYPHRVDGRGRYAFEHSPTSMTLWSQRQGFDPKMVTWNEVREMKDWGAISREESLMIDQHINRWEGIKQ